ncbi:MAG: LysM peptidoglycan-binding domain-containing protein [Phycisphaeraceae bacterium]
MRQSTQVVVIPALALMVLVIGYYALRGRTPSATTPPQPRLATSPSAPGSSLSGSAIEAQPLPLADDPRQADAQLPPTPAADAVRQGVPPLFIEPPMGSQQSAQRTAAEDLDPGVTLLIDAPKASPFSPEKRGQDGPAKNPPSAAISTDADGNLMYSVQPGDTLATLSRKLYGGKVTWEQIAQVNPWVDPKSLRAGQVIRLPAPPSADQPAQDTAASGTTTAPPPPPGAAATGEANLYTVKQGDTFWSIAQQAYGDGSKWEKIYQANRQTVGSDPGAIKPGMKLTIPR